MRRKLWEVVCSSGIRKQQTNKQTEQQQINNNNKKKLPIATTTKYPVTERETGIKAESRHGYLWYGHSGALNSAGRPHLKYELAWNREQAFFHETFCYH